MKRRLALPLLAAMLVAVPFVTAATAVASTPAKPSGSVPLRARLTACPLPQSGKAVAFAASMPALPGSPAGSRMAMKFELQQRGGGRPWLPVDGIPSFDQWEQSQPGRPGFVVTKKVKGLPVGGAFRAVVRFRWLDPKGVVVKVAKRITANCKQPDTRPDLVPSAPQIVKGSRPDLVVYKVLVTNAGKGRAIGTSVSVEVNGTVQPVQRIDPLSVNGSLVVTFQALPCVSGSIVRFRVDAADELTEVNERNNVLERRCVARTSSGSATTARLRASTV